MAVTWHGQRAQHVETPLLVTTTSSSVSHEVEHKERHRDASTSAEGDVAGRGAPVVDRLPSQDHDEPAEALTEKTDKVRPTRHPLWFCAWLLRRVFAAHVLVCVYCAGKLRTVEIATEPEATRRIAREERKRGGEAVEPGSTLEARGPPWGPPGQLTLAFR